MNEQGFLFQQRVRERIEGTYARGEENHPWQPIVIEYAVTTADERQTRVDLVLSNHQGVYLCVECKRARPKYKSWVFFDQSPSTGVQPDNELFMHTIFRSNSQMKYQQVLAHKPMDCACFNYYLEVKEDSSGKSSSTDAIEDALSQVMFGQVGLMSRLAKLGQEFRFTAVPVVVTTAQLFHAEFDIAKVTLDGGVLNSDDLTLKPADYLAVNYHVGDNFAVSDDIASVPPSHSNIESHLTYWQTRTAFVVQAKSDSRFLAWSRGSIDLGPVRY